MWCQDAPTEPEELPQAVLDILQLSSGAARTFRSDRQAALPASSRRADEAVRLVPSQSRTEEDKQSAINAHEQTCPAFHSAGDQLTSPGRLVDVSVSPPKLEPPDFSLGPQDSVFQEPSLPLTQRCA